MSKQLFVKLQSPTIELQVKAEDSSDTKAVITVGFKRYELDKTNIKLLDLQTLLSNHLDLLTSKQDGESVDQSDLDQTSKDVDNFIYEHVSYIKKAKLDMIDDSTGEASELIVNDTRKAKPVEDFWENAEECLTALLDMYLASSPWRSSFIASLQAALLNANYNDGKLKN